VKSEIAKAIAYNDKIFGNGDWVKINNAHKGQIYYIGNKYIYIQESDYFCPKECYHAEKYRESCENPCSCKSVKLNINDIKTIEAIEPMW